MEMGAAVAIAATRHFTVRYADGPPTATFCPGSATPDHAHIRPARRPYPGAIRPRHVRAVSALPSVRSADCQLRGGRRACAQPAGGASGSLPCARFGGTPGSTGAACSRLISKGAKHRKHCADKPDQNARDCSPRAWNAPGDRKADDEKHRSPDREHIDPPE